MGEEILRITVEQRMRGDIREELWIVVARSRLDRLGITQEELAESVRMYFTEFYSDILAGVPFVGNPDAPLRKDSLAIKPSIRILLSEGIRLEYRELREGKVVREEHDLLKLPLDEEGDCPKEEMSR